MSLEELSDIGRELRDVLAEVDRLSLLIGGPADRPLDGLEAQWKAARIKAHATSTTIHGKARSVDAHNNAADEASLPEWAAYNAAVYGLRAAKERAHSLRQLLSAMQTGTRIESDFTRTAPESSFGARRAS
jgi:hypothetical protein